MRSIGALRYPEKSHRKKVQLPKESVRLAEFFGIMIGDGGINNPWQANITLNSVADVQYIEFVASLCTDLFGVSPAIRKRKGRNASIVSLASTTIVDFLVEKGLMRGNKLKQGLCIPEWILTKRSYKSACVRGLMDTDGCLYVHRHTINHKKYQNIGLCFSSYSPGLIGQVAEIFVEFGIMPHISASGRNIYLYSQKDVSKYLDVFGSSNDRIWSVHKNWRGD